MLASDKGFKLYDLGITYSLWSVILCLKQYLNSIPLTQFIK